MGNKKDEIAYLEEVFGISKPKQTSGYKSDTATSDKSESTKVTLEPTTATSDQSGSTKISPEPAIATSDQSVSTEIATSLSSSITAPTSNQVPEAASPNTTPSTVPSSTSGAPLTSPGSAHYSAPYGTSNKSHVDMLLTMKDSWMLRHCDSYLDELKSCRSLRGRFHQFYVHGRRMDCSDWEASFDDCKAWNSKADEPAARRIIDREKLRIGRRLKAHYDNDVWEKRQAPPPEWEKPLPKWLTDKNQDSYFAAYIAEKKKEATATTKMTGVDAMEVELEDSQVLLNSPDLNRQAVILQKNLEELKMKIIKTKAELIVKNQSYGGENTDDLLYGKQEVNEDDLHNLVVQRTKTFLNFTSLQTALKAAQANAAITNALNLEKDTNIQLEEEEEQYVRELLEDQKILAEEIIANQNKVVDQELQLIDSRIKLAEDHRRYQDLFEKVKPARIASGHTKDGQVKELQQQLTLEEEKLNQIRFMIQKFMISHPKMGLQFDKETNERFKNIFMSCGTSPEDLRAKLRQDSA